MKDEELVGLARQGLNMAITERRNTGRGHLVLATYHEGEGMHRWRNVEKQLIQKLGEDWLNDERRKDLGFGFLREVVDLAPPHAVIMVTPTNLFKPTAKMKALGIDKQKWLADRGNKDHHQLAAEGLLEVVDSMSATVQTPERVCFAMQEVNDEGLVGQPMVRVFGQDGFSGRLKMFGEDKLEAERQKGRAN